ncbi:MAG: hypothetical protein BGO86_07600 [Chryseobacterium sp. 36-9]|nr:MAG: hypothetical protein BGO86_07600 [Chryseobacterium sp. 36-9]
MFNLLNSKDNLKRKILDIKNEMRMIVSEVSAENVRVDWFGAYNIAPKYLAFWICVQTDLVKEELIANKDLHLKLYSLLEEYDYPSEARRFVFIGFESQQTVDRESNGNWYQHYK